ncbi:MAG: 30S ribosomal protein S19 [Candidatus Campbellbacteria bacterium]|nr:30S ribosomal protein S19 [Candidatus Campbellbacteria bacterium]
MARSIKKGPHIDFKLMKKIDGKTPEQVGDIKTWARASQISPKMIGFTFLVHNGKTFIKVFVTEEMVGHRLGEFSPTKRFVKHGGKIQKELDQKRKEAEITAAKAARETSAAKK